MGDYDKVGLLAVRDGRVLLCRKKHTTSLLILPGGRREAGESSMECLLRELDEELGEVAVNDLEFIGVYEDQAAGEPGKRVRIELYQGSLTGEPSPRSEIKELVWFGSGDDPELLAPSLRNKIFPDLASRGLLPSTYNCSP